MTMFIVVVIVVGAVLLWWLLRRVGSNRSSELFDVFDLSPDEHTLIGSDLGGSTNRVFLRTDQVIGVPDAVFRGKGSITIGEAKSRHYRGHITDYENYQVQLYMGAAERSYRKPTRALIRYGCGAVVPVEFDRETYRHLLSLIPQCRDALTRIAASRKR